jgi:hypothetical protein
VSTFKKRITRQLVRGEEEYRVFVRVGTEEEPRGGGNTFSKVENIVICG